MQTVEDNPSVPPPSYEECNADVVLDGSPGPARSRPVTPQPVAANISAAVTPSSRETGSASVNNASSSRATSFFSRALNSVTTTNTVIPPGTPTPEPVRHAARPPPSASLDRANPVVLTWQSTEDVTIVGNSTGENAISHIRYTFSPVGHHSMVLLPPVNSLDTRPIYHVSWREDFWSPGSLVTTVRRGGSEDGQFVGEFGLGMVRLDGRERRLNTMLTESQYIRGGMWWWQRNGKRIRWSKEKKHQERQVPWFRCVMFHSDREDDFVHIASLKPPSYKPAAAGNVRVPELKVYPAGAPIIDDIVLTALMLERIRLEKDHDN